MPASLQPVVVIRYGEIALKGKNRGQFIGQLEKNVAFALRELTDWELRRTHGRLFVEFTRDLPWENGGSHLADQVLARLQRVFGVVSASLAVRTELSLEAVQHAAAVVMAAARRRLPREPVTFKVECRRPNKGFPLTSPEVARLVGAHLLRTLPGLRVDVHHPDLTVEVELREQAYINASLVAGPGGLPVGVSGRGMVLLSGGIDSPVAAWLALKRGIEVQAVHFHSFPFTSERAKEKVLDLCKVLAPYAAGTLVLHVVHFTEVQKVLQSDGPPELLTILMRRAMMRLAGRIAAETGALALITGESVGQVASQTLESLLVTNAAASLPVLRPLITYDKTEIMELARRIGTYEISIRPYQDCCALFVPRHPKTRPRLAAVERVEAGLELADLLTEAVNTREVLRF